MTYQTFVHIRGVVITVFLLVLLNRSTRFTLCNLSCHDWRQFKVWSNNTSRCSKFSWRKFVKVITGYEFPLSYVVCFMLFFFKVVSFSSKLTWLKSVTFFILWAVGDCFEVSMCIQQLDNQLHLWIQIRIFLQSV